MLQVAAEQIGRVGNIPITNTMLSAALVTIFLSVIVILFSRNIELIPGKFQNFIEFVIEFMFNTAKEAVGDDGRTRAFFPLIATFFLFILFSNWSGLLPIFGTIGFHSSFSGESFTPLFRSVNSDLNSTAAMAIISAIATQYFAIKYLGLGNHLKRYISWNPIYMFVNLLEILSEFTKIISLSLRLYGNIIAGDIVIATFTSFVGILIPLPFMGLEVVVGLVQAAVFAMLSLAFTNVLTQKLH